MHSYITKALLETKLYQRRSRKFRSVPVKVGASRFECLTPVFWKLNIWLKGLLLLGFYKDCRDHSWIIFGAMKHRYLSNKLHENFCKQHWRPWCCNVAKNPNTLCKNNFFSHVFLWKSKLTLLLRLWSLPNEISVINGVVEALQLPIVSKLNTLDWCFLWKCFKVDF